MTAALPDTDTWHETLMAWGAYRTGYNRTHLGYGRTVYERMMAGLKGTICNTCIGRGSVRDVVSGSWTACPVCKGKGKINVATKGKINPALIRSTRGDTPFEEEPEIFTRIDRAMGKLTIRHRIVIVSRYIDYPRRNDSDRRLKNVNAWLMKIGEAAITKRRMENVLSDARAELQRLVDAKPRRGVDTHEQNS